MFFFSYLIDHFFSNEGISHHYIHLHLFHSFSSRFHSIFFLELFAFQCIHPPPSFGMWHTVRHMQTLHYIEMMIAPIKCALRNCYARKQQQQQHTNHSNQIN